MDQFVEEVNEVIREGKVPPKSKTPELIPRLACALYVFNHIMGELLASVSATQPPTIISKATLESAASPIRIPNRNYISFLVFHSIVQDDFASDLQLY